MKLYNPNHKMYVSSMGKLLRVTACFTNDDEANAYMLKNKDEAVIAVFGDLILLANVHDKGLKLQERNW